MNQYKIKTKDESELQELLDLLHTNQIEIKKESRKKLQVIAVLDDVWPNLLTEQGFTVIPEEDMSQYHVPIDDNSIYWMLKAREITGLPKGKQPCGGNKVVQVEWGWSAGMSDEELANMADDAPNWKYSVRTTLEMAEEFHKELGDLIARMKGA